MKGSKKRKSDDSPIDEQKISPIAVFGDSPLQHAIHELQDTKHILLHAERMLTDGNIESLLTYFRIGYTRDGWHIPSIIIGQDVRIGHILAHQIEEYVFADSDFSFKYDTKVFQDFTVFFNEQRIGQLDVRSRTLISDVDVIDLLSRKERLFKELDANKTELEKEEVDLKEQLKEYGGIFLRHRHQQAIEKIKNRLKQIPEFLQGIEQKKVEIEKTHQLATELFDGLSVLSRFLEPFGIQVAIRMQNGMTVPFQAGEIAREVDESKIQTAVRLGKGQTSEPEVSSEEHLESSDESSEGHASEEPVPEKTDEPTEEQTANIVPAGFTTPLPEAEPIMKSVPITEALQNVTPSEGTTKVAPTAATPVATRKDEQRDEEKPILTITLPNRKEVQREGVHEEHPPSSTTYLPPAFDPSIYLGRTPSQQASPDTTDDVTFLVDPEPNSQETANQKTVPDETVSPSAKDEVGETNQVEASDNEFHQEGTATDEVTADENNDTSDLNAEACSEDNERASTEVEPEGSLSVQQDAPLDETSQDKQNTHNADKDAEQAIENETPTEENESVSNPDESSAGDTASESDVDPYDFSKFAPKRTSRKRRHRRKRKNKRKETKNE